MSGLGPIVYFTDLQGDIRQVMTETGNDRNARARSNCTTDL